MAEIISIAAGTPILNQGEMNRLERQVGREINESLVDWSASVYYALGITNLVDSLSRSCRSCKRFYYAEGFS